MKRVVVTILSLALALFVVAACGGNACEDAFNKSKTCVSSADCSTAGSATAIAGCNAAKAYFTSLTYGQLETLCKQQNPGADCSCNSADQAAADKVLSCKDIDSPAPACLNCLQ